MSAEIERESQKSLVTGDSEYLRRNWIMKVGIAYNIVYSLHARAW